MEKFTKGPWEVSGLTGNHINGAGYYNRLNHPVTPCVATVKHRIGQTDANAALIAAGPDLFYALQDAILQIEYLHEKFHATGSGEAVLAKARAAIAKALGGSHE